MQHKEDSEKSWPVLAKVTGTSDSTLSQFAKGTYPSPSSVEEKVTKYFDGVKDTTDLKVFNTIAATRTMDEITLKLRYAQTISTIAVIAGAPGVGKTVACRQFVADGNQRWLITASPAHSSVSAVLQMIAEAIGMATVANNATNASNIARKLGDTNGILIIDESQHLSRLAIEQIRSIRDATHDTVAIALVGNAKVGSAFTDTTTRADFAQIRSRVGIRMNRQGAYLKDAHTLAEQWGLGEHRQALWQIAQKDGGLRWAAQVAKLALTMAGGDAVTTTTIDQAWAMVGGQ